MKTLKIDKKFLRENWKLIAAIAYILSPIDILPDVIPLLGVGDDALVLLATLIHKYYKQNKDAKKLAEDGKTTVVEGELVE